MISMEQIKLPVNIKVNDTNKNKEKNFDFKSI
jgi:hypothetical protein